MYESFIIAKIKIYLQKHIGIERADTLGDPVKLVGLVSNILSGMGEIAFTELLGGKPLSKKLVPPDLYRDLLNFGIIVGRREEQLGGKIRYRYFFMQETFRELFAALYIVKALSESKKSSIYQAVFLAVVKMRYEPRLQVVWRFVRDLLDVGTVLLLNVKTKMNARAVFASPKDHIGVAEHNLLVQLGLHSRAIKVRELDSKSIKTVENTAFHSPVEDDGIEEIGQKLESTLAQFNAGIGKDAGVSLVSSLPDEIPDGLLTQYFNILKKGLSHQLYRVSGSVMEKFAKTDIKCDASFLQTIFDKIVACKEWHGYQVKSAIKAMLKVDVAQYARVFNLYLQLLNKKDFSIEFKVEILICIEVLIGQDADLDNRIAKVMDKGVVDTDKQGDASYQEAMLRELLLIKLSSKEVRYFEEYKTVDLIKIVVSDLSESRMELIIELISHEFVKLNEVKENLLLAFKLYNNRHETSKCAMRLYEYLKKKGWSVDFLCDVLMEANQVSDSKLLVKAVGLVGPNIFECDQDESHWRFWRLDAGIPVAKFFLQDGSLQVTGVAYLIYQIRNNLLAYDVSNKILTFLYDFDSEGSMQRCMALYLACEYLSRSLFKSGSYFNVLDSYSSLVKKLFDLAWLHFKEDKRYPLIGLDLIFSLGVYYGLPLIEVGDKLELLIVGISQPTLLSPALDQQQKEIAKHHFSNLRRLCGPRFRLTNMMAETDRASLLTQCLVISRESVGS